MDTLITDWEKFQVFAARHGDSFRQKWRSFGRGQISVRTISRALHKIGFTRKKRRMATLNAPEAKRQAFVEQLALIPISQRVYVDEAGMDNRPGVRLRLESALENAFMQRFFAGE